MTLSTWRFSNILVFNVQVITKLFLRVCFPLHGNRRRVALVTQYRLTSKTTFYFAKSFQRELHAPIRPRILGWLLMLMRAWLPFIKLLALL